MNTDILIVGGGPFGLMLANELGRRNIACLLVDSKPSTAFNPQANATQARTMEHYRRLGFADEIRDQGLPANHPTDIAYFTRFMKHELARIQLPTAAQAKINIKSMSGSWSAAELPHRVSQKFVEQTLLKHAQSLSSADIRYGWKMERFDENESGVKATIRNVNQMQTHEVQAKFMVGADGARSAIRHALGVAWDGETGTLRDYMGGKMLAIYMRAPTFHERFPHAKAWMYVAFNHQRRALMASVDGVAEYAFHLAIKPGEDADSWGELDARRLIAEVMGIELPFEILSMSTWTAGHALVANRFQQGRIFLGGDAAHLFTPTGGLGYNTAVEDAVNLGWKFASVVRGVAPIGLLDTYETERKPLAQRNTQYAKGFADSVGLFAAKVELEEDSERGQEERKRAATHLDAHLKREFNIPGITLGGRYDGSPIIISDGSSPPKDQANIYEPTACPGGRPPHSWMEDGSSLYDHFGFEWTLLALQGADPSTYELAAKQLGIELKVLRLENTKLLELYQAPLTLIRPDHIVAWRGKSGDGANAVLKQALGLIT